MTTSLDEIPFVTNDLASEQTKSRGVEGAFDAQLALHPERAHDAWGLFREALFAKKVQFGTEMLPVSLKPHLISSRLHGRWVTSTERLFQLLEQFGQNALQDEGIYAALDLPQEAKTLFDIDPGYKRIAVVARPDMVWSGAEVSTYEINTDSPAMMTFTDFIQDIQRDLFPMVQLEKEYNFQFLQRTTGLLDAMLACYREWGGNLESPSIAIIDWSGQKTQREQECTAEMFSQKGYPAFTCDPRELSIENGKLHGRGRRIEIVQRRVLCPDFIRRPEELATLLTAYRKGLVCMVNPLRSYLLGNKSLLSLLFNERYAKDFAAEDLSFLRKTVLATERVDDRVRNRIRHEKDQYVLKGAFGHGGSEVFIGKKMSESEWFTRLEATRDGFWVAQVYREPPIYRIPVFGPGREIRLAERMANWNPFVFGGKFGGGMTRVSTSPIVSITANGALLPCIPVRGL